MGPSRIISLRGALSASYQSGKYFLNRIPSKMKNNRQKEIADLVGNGPERLPLQMISSELAHLFGCTHRTINILSERGTLSPLPNGKFDTVLSIQRYLNFSRKGGNSKLDDEKVRLTREQADKVEIQNQKERGELILVAEVQHTWASILKDVRQGMLAVPTRAQTRLPHLTQHDISELDLEIRSALERLSDE